MDLCCWVGGRHQLARLCMRRWPVLPPAPLCCPLHRLLLVTHPPAYPTVSPTHPLQAREAYERAVKLEPNDTTLAISLQKASSKEAKQISEVGWGG